MTISHGYFVMAAGNPRGLVCICVSEIRTASIEDFGPYEGPFGAIGESRHLYGATFDRRDRVEQGLEVARLLPFATDEAIEELRRAGNIVPMNRDDDFEKCFVLADAESMRKVLYEIVLDVLRKSDDPEHPADPRELELHAIQRSGNIVARAMAEQAYWYTLKQMRVVGGVFDAHAEQIERFPGTAADHDGDRQRDGGSVAEWAEAVRLTVEQNLKGTSIRKSGIVIVAM